MNNGATPMHIAAQKGYADVIRVLAKFGVDVNIPLNNGATPMHIAAEQGHANAIRVLKELGARKSTRCSIS